MNTISHIAVSITRSFYGYKLQPFICRKMAMRIIALLSRFNDNEQINASDFDYFLRRLENALCAQHCSL